MKENKWTDEVVEQLKYLYLNEGISTVKIAEKLGFTKNAIIGKLHRMGISKSSNTKESVIEDLFKNKEPIKDIKPTYEQYKLQEIGRNMCIWPIGEDDFLFCGRPVSNEASYCETHMALVYLPPKKVSKRKIVDIYTEEDMEADIEEDEEDEEKQ